MRTRRKRKLSSRIEDQATSATREHRAKLMRRRSLFLQRRSRTNHETRSLPAGEREQKVYRRKGAMRQNIERAVLFVALMVVGSTSAVDAQAPTVSLEDQLKAQFTLVKMGADSS